MGNLVVEAVELFHGDGFRVENQNLCFIFAHLPSLAQERKGSCQHFDAATFACERPANHHETMSYQDHFV